MIKFTVLSLVKPVNKLFITSFVSLVMFSNQDFSTGLGYTFGVKSKGLSIINAVPISFITE